MKVLITDKFDQDAIIYLEKNNFNLSYQPEISPDNLANSVSDYEALIIRGRTIINSEVLKRADKLKLIARAGSGTDNIDKEVAKIKNIAVINAPGANAQAVAELTVGLIISLIRHIPAGDKSIREGKWIKKDLIGSEIYNKTVGIIGFGNVGKRVAVTLRGFGANILYVNSRDRQDKVENLLQKSDIISLHLRLNDSTRGFIDKNKIKLMKNSAYLINCARGGLIVEDVLYDALVHREIAGAALDVFWNEPLEKNSHWLKLSNVILTPHLGGQTKEAIKNACFRVASDLTKFFKGEVINSRVV